VCFICRSGFEGGDLPRIEVLGSEGSRLDVVNCPRLTGVEGISFKKFLILAPSYYLVKADVKLLEVTDVLGC